MRTISWIVAFCAVLAGVARGDLIPFSYTGQVNSIQSDVPLSLKYGDPLPYRFNFDVDLEGFVVAAGGTSIPVAGALETEYVDEFGISHELDPFYAEFLGPFLLPELGASPSYQGSFGYYDYLTGPGELSPSSYRLTLIGGSDIHYISITGTYNIGEAWSPENMKSSMEFSNGGSVQALMYGYVLPPPPPPPPPEPPAVPEPNLMILLIAGGVFLAGSRRRLRG